MVFVLFLPAEVVRTFWLLCGNDCIVEDRLDGDRYEGKGRL